MITRCTKDSRNCYNQQFTRLTQTLSYQNYGNISEFLDHIKLLEEQIDATKGNLEDKLWPEIVLAMTYVKNIRRTKALDGDNPYHAQQISNPNIQHFRVLGSTVYVRLHEEERALKSENGNRELCAEPSLDTTAKPSTEFIFGSKTRSFAPKTFASSKTMRQEHPTIYLTTGTLPPSKVFFCLITTMRLGMTLKKIDLR